MTNFKKRLIVFSLLIILTLSLTIVCIFISSSSDIVDISSKNPKILFEYGVGDAISVTNSIESIPVAEYDDNKISMQIMLDYEPYNDVIYEEQHLDGETFVEYSKRYHTTKNQELLSNINTNDFNVFVSEYTPYIFIDCNNGDTVNQVYTYAQDIADNEFINHIRIFPSSIYDLNTSLMEEARYENTIYDSEKGIQTSAATSSDTRITDYENFPAGTPYKGTGIKIGVLETGIFNTSHPNFSEITAEVVYDTSTSNTSQHPTMVASVLGGKYGYASSASIYYVDVNSETSYVGIERLINKGCHIINMSISASSCENNGEYDTGIEGYLDYIYTSTKVIMVAAASNYLDMKGTGGYVALPALCANIISVGSVNSTGVPSYFSSYNTKNDVRSNPNLVAVGETRRIEGFGYFDGTSFSTPAVTGAIALYFEKYGVKDFPSMLAILSATANDSIIDKSIQKIYWKEKNASGNYYTTTEYFYCANIPKNNGSYSRTGAGMLDVTALLNYSEYMLNFELTFPSTDFVDLKHVYLSAGQTIKFALAWQRNVTVTIDEFLWWETDRTYTLDPVADFDLYLYTNTGALKKSITSSDTNVEILTYTAETSGYYVVKVKPYSNYTEIYNINFAHVVN